MMNDKRKYVRLNVYVDVAWRKIVDPAPKPTSQGDVARNISEGGLCLNINEKVEVGSFLDVIIALPGQKIIRSRSRVQWVRESEIVTKRYDVGLEFQDISDQDREEIRSFVFASSQNRRSV